MGVETRELLQQLNESSFMAAQLQDCLIGATAQLEAAVAHCNQMQKQIESLQQAEPTAANREERLRDRVRQLEVRVQALRIHERSDDQHVPHEADTSACSRFDASQVPLAGETPDCAA